MVAGDYSINTGKVRDFSIEDYVLFVITLLISAGIGVFYAIWDRKRNTKKDFLLGGKNMNVFPVAMSLMVTFMSAMTLLGNPAEIYNYDTMFWWLIVAFVFAVTGAAYIFIPFFYNLQVTSTFEYLEMRFSKPVRSLASSLLILQTVLYMAFLLYAPSVAINAVTSLNLWGSVVGIGVVATFYTTLGGMKAVLWTDTFQAGIIIAGLLAVLIQGSIVTGGFANAWNIAESRSRILFDDFSFDPKTRHSVWSVVIGSILYWTYLYGINQAQVQRCLSCPTIRKAQLAMFINLPGLMIIVSFCCMIGIVMFAFYADCHPITYGIIDKTDQLVPLFVMDILGHLKGVPGIFLSCVVAGSLSSLSSGLNALSAVTYSDWLQSFSYFQNASELRSTIVSKLLVVVYGLLSIAFAWVVSQLGNILQAGYMVFGVLNGPILGVMTLGMFCPWANKWGAFVGMVTSLTLMLWIGLAAFINNISTPLTYTLTTACNWTALQPPGANLSMTTTTTTTTEAPSLALEPLYRMSYLWYAGLGMTLVWGVGITVTLFTGYTKPTSLDPRLILPIFDKLFPYLPEKILKPLRFGIIHKGKYDLPVDKIVDIKQPTDGEFTDHVKQKNGLHDAEFTDHVKQKNGLHDACLENGKLKIRQGQDNKAYTTDKEDGHIKTTTRL